MIKTDQRKHERHLETAAISYGFLNKTTRYIGFVKNICEYGMYFLAERPISVGALVSIQPLSCSLFEPRGLSPQDKESADRFCSESNPEAGGGRLVKSMVIGKIVHCSQLENSLPSSYGIGARYESPSV